MVERVSVHGLQVARALHDFIAQEALPGSGVDAENFWSGFAALAARLMPQNIATGVAISGLQGQESSIFRRTFIHSLVFTALLSILVWLQQFVFPWMIPLVPPH